MPKEIPDEESGGDELQFQRLIEKLKEAKKANQDSIDAKMWGYSGFDSVAPYDVFDFRVSRHRSGQPRRVENCARRSHAQFSIVCKPSSMAR